MIKKVLFTTLLSVSLMASNAFASTKEEVKEVASTTEQTISNNIQKVLDEYKAYLSTLPKEVREEIINYRTELAKINRQKREMYQKLSSVAQNHLSKEQEFKKKLPIKQRKFINDSMSDNTGTGN